MNLVKSYVNHEISKINTTINPTIDTLLELDKLPTYQKRAIYTKNDLVIKFIYYDINKLSDTISDNLNSEIFLVNQYIENKFTHPYFLPYLGITNINSFKQKIFTNSECIKDEDIIMQIPVNIGIIMPMYKTLDKYLFDNLDLDYKFVLTNIYNILDLAILIRDKYNIIHCDVKIDNIVVNDNKFYLIDWENAFECNEMYYNEDRPTSGNSEMYPHYDVDSEQFFVYSIGVLITRIIGFHNGVKSTDFVSNNLLHFILSKIPNSVLQYYEDLLINIFVIKINKIEVLKDKIRKIINIE